MNTLKLLILAVIVSGCSKLPAPSLISPTQNNNTQSVSYGIPPDNYQKVLKDYLIKNLKDYKTAKVEFINEPAKSTIDHFHCGLTFTVELSQWLPLHAVQL